MQSFKVLRCFGAVFEFLSEMVISSKMIKVEFREFFFIDNLETNFCGRFQTLLGMFIKIKGRLYSLQNLKT